MAIFTPSWTDTGATVIAPTNLAKGALAQGTLDLTNKRGGYLFAAIGRTGTTALLNGCWFLARRLLNNHAVAFPGVICKRLSSIAAAAQTTIATSDSNSGQKSVNVASITGFAADDYGSINAAGSVTRLEFFRVSKTATGILTADANLTISHTTAQADKVQNKADLWVFPVEGGCVVECLFDYGFETGTPENLNVAAWYQRYDSDVGA
jgi:hypothetical protein